MASDRARLVLWPAIVAHFVGYGSFTLVAPLYALHFGANAAVIGAIVSLGFLLPLPLALPAGAALPRIGLRRLLILGPLLVVLGLVAPIAVPGLPALVIAEVVVGIGHLAVVLAGQTAVGTLDAASHGEANFGAYAASVAIGQMTGPIAAGALGSAFGLRMSLAAAAAAALLAGTILALGRRHLPALPPASGQDRTSRRRGAVRSPSLRYAMTLSGLIVLARMAHSTFLPVYLAGHGYGSRDIGLLVALLALVTVLVRPLLSGITELVGGQVPAMLLALAFTTVGVVSIAAPPTWLGLVAMTLVLGIGVGVGQPLSMVVASNSVSAQERGVALGYRIMTNRFTQVASPLLLGLLATPLGVAATFLLAGGVIAALLPMMVRTRNVVAPASDRTYEGAERPE